MSHIVTYVCILLYQRLQKYVVFLYKYVYYTTLLICFNVLFHACVTAETGCNFKKKTVLCVTKIPTLFWYTEPTQNGHN